MATADSKLDIFLKLRTDVSELRKGVEDIKAAKVELSSMSDLGKAVLQGGGINIGWTLVDKVKGGIHEIRSFVEEGIGLHAKLESSTLAIAGIMRAAAPDKFGDTKVAMQEAAKAIEMVHQSADKAHVPLTQLLDTFRAGTALMTRGGMSTSDQVNLIAMLTKVGGRAGIDAGEVSSSINGMLAGVRVERNAIGRQMGMSQEDVDLAKENGMLFDLLKAKASEYNKSLDGVGLTFKQLQADIGNAMEQLQLKLAEPIFQAMKEALAEVKHALEDMGTNGAKQVGTAIGELASLVIRLGIAVKDAIPYVWGAVKAWLAFKVATLAPGMFESLRYQFTLLQMSLRQTASSYTTAAAAARAFTTATGVGALLAIGSIAYDIYDSTKAREKSEEGISEHSQATAAAMEQQATHARELNEKALSKLNAEERLAALQGKQADLAAKAAKEDADYAERIARLEKERDAKVGSMQRATKRSFVPGYGYYDTPLYTPEQIGKESYTFNRKIEGLKIERGVRAEGNATEGKLAGIAGREAEAKYAIDRQAALDAINPLDKVGARAARDLKIGDLAENLGFSSGEEALAHANELSLTQLQTLKEIRELTKKNNDEDLEAQREHQKLADEINGIMFNRLDTAGKISVLEQRLAEARGSLAGLTGDEALSKSRDALKLEDQIAQLKGGGKSPDFSAFKPASDALSRIGGFGTFNQSILEAQSFKDLQKQAVDLLKSIDRNTAKAASDSTAIFD